MALQKVQSEYVEGSENWDSTYTTVSANSAAWAIDTVGGGTGGSGLSGDLTIDLRQGDTTTEGGDTAAGITVSQTFLDSLSAYKNLNGHTLRLQVHDNNSNPTLYEFPYPDSDQAHIEGFHNGTLVIGGIGNGDGSDKRIRVGYAAGSAGRGFRVWNNTATIRIENCSFETAHCTNTNSNYLLDLRNNETVHIGNQEPTPGSPGTNQHNYKVYIGAAYCTPTDAQKPNGIYASMCTSVYIIQPDFRYVNWALYLRMTGFVWLESATGPNSSNMSAGTAYIEGSTLYDQNNHNSMDATVNLQNGGQHLT